jgi:hypothetical protein
MSFSIKGLQELKVQKKNRIISDLKTGDMIKVKAEFLPIIHHYGIIQEKGDGLYIYHLQPDKKNSDGGNLVCEPLQNYMIGRDVVSVIKTDVTSYDIEKMFEALKKYKYDFIGFNCEHFVNFTTDKKMVSNQVFKWGSIIAIGVLVTWMIRKGKI